MSDDDVTNEMTIAHFSRLQLSLMSMGSISILSHRLDVRRHVGGKNISVETAIIVTELHGV